MKKIDKLIPFADEAVKEELIENERNESLYIPKEYNGYISSFGASVIQSGLIAALYANHQSGDSTVDRKKLMAAIFYVVKKHRNDTTTRHTNLLEYVENMNNSGDTKNLKKDILDAATAIKLVIRTYKLKKS
jgi:CRISPR-associated protein Cmr5